MVGAEHALDKVFAHLAWALVALGVAGAVTFVLAPSVNGANTVYYVVSTLAIGLGWAGILRRPFAGRWIAIFVLAAASTWLLADWVWWLTELSGQTTPFPGPLDAVYLGGYALALLALARFWRRHKTEALGGLLESAFLAMVIGVLIWAIAVAPPGGEAQVSGFVTFTAVAYPALDTMLLVGLGQLLLAPSFRRVPSLYGFAIGVALFLASDILYAFGSIRDIYVDATWRDLGWMLAYVAWGFAAAHPSLSTFGSIKISPVRRWALRTALLGLMCLTMPVAFLIAEHRSATNLTVFLILGCLMISVVFLRMGLILRVEQRYKEELADTLEKLRALIETAPLAISAIDGKGLITIWNPRAEELFGWRVDEVVGKPNPLCADPGVSGNLERVFSGETIYEESERTRKDGSVVDVIVSASPLRDQAGEIAGGVALFLDTSDRKALEERLRHSQRLETVGQLAGGVAHDFNNLLTAITGYCELSLERANGDPELAHDLQEIARASSRATDLTRQLLAFGRRQVLRNTTFDLNQAVMEINAILTRLLGENIKIVHSLDPLGCPVETDKGQIGQVLLNLAVNARDAMPDGGTLTFSTENVNLGAARAESLSLEPGRYVHLRVSDSGSGMAREVRERVFEPFFTTKDVGKGSGLGLATVYGIVTQSGGQIVVESEPGIGTSFDIYLPWSEAEAAADLELPSQQASSGNERILLVEDEPGVREITAQMLERKGYEVRVAAEPHQAIDLALHLDFDLVITDLVLPDMDGRRLAAELRELKPELRVVYTSGYPRDSLGEHDPSRLWFLQKPYSVDELSATVRGALDSESPAVSN